MDRLKQVWEFLTRPDVYWRLFSLLLAVIFWLLAAGDGSLGGTERLVMLDVEVHNLPADLVLLDSPGQVRARLRGLSPILNRGEDAVRAWIDLADTAEGTETFGVEVDGPAGIEIVSFTPRWVSIYTERLTEGVFPVTLALLGMERSNFITSVKPDPAVVTVRGPASILEQVDHVVAHIGLGQTFSDSEQHFPVQALDAKGRTLDLLEIEPPVIKVRAKQQTVGEESAE